MAEIDKTLPTTDLPPVVAPDVEIPVADETKLIETEGIEATELPDGGMDINFDPSSKPQIPGTEGHFDNLADLLPDDILTKVDRASMAVSLEIRVPLLDHTLVEFAQRLPIEMKIMGNKGKWPLRKILNRYIDEDLYDRPKTGFGVPIGEWLRGPLKDWADDILAVDRIQQGGYLDAKWVSKRWADHRAGNGNWQYLLWDVLMFESWRESVDL